MYSDLYPWDLTAEQIVSGRVSIEGVPTRSNTSIARPSSDDFEKDRRQGLWLIYASQLLLLVLHNSVVRCKFTDELDYPTLIEIVRLSCQGRPGNIVNAVKTVRERYGSMGKNTMPSYSADEPSMDFKLVSKFMVATTTQLGRRLKELGFVVGDLFDKKDDERPEIPSLKDIRANAARTEADAIASKHGQRPIFCEEVEATGESVPNGMLPAHAAPPPAPRTSPPSTTNKAGKETSMPDATLPAQTQAPPPPPPPTEDGKTKQEASRLHNTPPKQPQPASTTSPLSANETETGAETEKPSANGTMPIQSPSAPAAPSARDDTMGGTSVPDIIVQPQSGLAEDNTTTTRDAKPLDTISAVTPAPLLPSSTSNAAEPKSTTPAHGQISPTGSTANSGRIANFNSTHDNSATTDRLSSKQKRVLMDEVWKFQCEIRSMEVLSADVLERGDILLARAMSADGLSTAQQTTRRLTKAMLDKHRPTIDVGMDDFDDGVAFWDEDSGVYMDYDSSKATGQAMPSSAAPGSSTSPPPPPEHAILRLLRPDVDMPPMTPGDCTALCSASIEDTKHNRDTSFTSLSTGQEVMLSDIVSLLHRDVSPEHSLPRAGWLTSGVICHLMRLMQNMLPSSKTPIHFSEMFIHASSVATDCDVGGRFLEEMRGLSEFTSGFNKDANHWISVHALVDGGVVNVDLYDPKLPDGVTEGDSNRTDLAEAESKMTALFTQLAREDYSVWTGAFEIQFVWRSCYYQIDHHSCGLFVIVVLICIRFRFREAETGNLPIQSCVGAGLSALRVRLLQLIAMDLVERTDITATAHPISLILALLAKIYPNAPPVPNKMVTRDASEPVDPTTPPTKDVPADDQSGQLPTDPLVRDHVASQALMSRLNIDGEPLRSWKDFVCGLVTDVVRHGQNKAKVMELAKDAQAIRDRISLDKTGPPTYQLGEEMRMAMHAALGIYDGCVTPFSRKLDPDATTFALPLIKDAGVVEHSDTVAFVNERQRRAKKGDTGGDSAAKGHVGAVATVKSRGQRRAFRAAVKSAEKETTASMAKATGTSLRKNGKKPGPLDPYLANDPQDRDAESVSDGAPSRPMRKMLHVAKPAPTVETKRTDDNMSDSSDLTDFIDDESASDAADELDDDEEPTNAVVRPGADGDEQSHVQTNRPQRAVKRKHNYNDRISYSDLNED